MQGPSFLAILRRHGVYRGWGTDVIACFQRICPSCFQELLHTFCRWSLKVFSFMTLDDEVRVRTPLWEQARNEKHVDWNKRETTHMMHNHHYRFHSICLRLNIKIKDSGFSSLCFINSTLFIKYRPWRFYSYCTLCKGTHCLMVPSVL